MSTTLKQLLAWLAAVALAVIMVWTVAQVRADRPDQDDDEQRGEAVQPSPSRVSVQNGQTVITLDPKAQSRAGITVAPLKIMTYRERITAPAVVLAAQELIGRRSNYVSGVARLEKARASVDVSQQEFDRLKVLYQDNQNASQKALEGAQGSLRSDQAEVRAAQQDLLLQSAALRQDWGAVVAKWVSDGSAPLDGLCEQRDLLVQVTMPFGTVPAAPESISLELPPSRFGQAKLISPFPRVDSRIQGVSFLYVTPNQTGLAPGLNLVGRMAVGGVLRGVLVPQQAIVWWQGRAWVYKQLAPARFVRQEADTGTQIEGGFFVAKGFSAGDRVVTSGAQILLSAELGRQAQGGEEDTD